MRSDALQRRRTILREARRMFAEIGRDVSLDAIAESSNVGIATLYRNFPSRENLINEVTLDVVSDIEDALTRLRAASLPPEHTWVRTVRELMALNLGALTEVLSTNTPVLQPETLAAQQRVLHQLDTELSRLTRAGVIRPEITAVTLIAALAVITRPQSTAIREAAPELRSHLVEAYLLWSQHRMSEVA